MTKQQSGAIRIAIPFIVMAIAGLIGLGSHQQKIQHNTVEIEKKVDKEVYDAYKEANERDHQRILEHLEVIQSDVKELLQK